MLFLGCYFFYVEHIFKLCVCIVRLTHSFWTQRYFTNIRQTWDLRYLLNWLGLPSEAKWPPTPVFLPGKSHGRRSLVGYSPWVAKSRTRLSDFTHLLSEEYGKYVKNSLCPSIPYTLSAVPHCFPSKFSMNLTINCPVGLFFFKLEVIG